ncbi:hypothetical protein A9Q84_15065 [Halobacteriovorax marinus]|uniref:Endonuclease/exonuclease/phosphatase domain-containing protein n=1 Tax=Halobacteriovorax marinus TaxID=97084 RepID=A0A1Y5F5P8_9BACT|nr:hypothetical protein A9Q84_15065 [Halobacteriovorax marinus]
MTWNIYFDDESGLKRYPAILETILKKQAAVVCLQEVTDVFIRLLQTSELTSHYTILGIEQTARYKNIILTNLNVEEFGIFQLPSNMSRCAPYLKVRSEDRTLTVVNLHLESMLEDTDIRTSQLSSVLDQTRSDMSLILCGDMNFGDDDFESRFVKEYFQDLGAVDARVTYDVENNQIAKATRFPGEGSRRLDRFLIKGEVEFSNYQLHLEPFSDHFPITVEIK